MRLLVRRRVYIYSGAVLLGIIVACAFGSDAEDSDWWSLVGEACAVLLGLLLGLILLGDS